MAEILSGDLISLRLIDILRILHLNIRTGRLHLTHRTQTGEIYFSKGQIVHAHYEGRLGEEAVYALLAKSQGNFVFAPLPAVDEKTITTATKEILARGDSIDKEWDAIRDFVSSAEALFSPSRVSGGDLSLPAPEAQVLHAVNGRRTVLDIAEHCRQSELDVSRILRKLLQLGLIEIAGEVDTPGPESMVDSMIFEVIEYELTKALGPIAPIILDEQIERIGEHRYSFPKRRLAELAELVSREIPSEPKQIEFQQVMVQLLKKV